MMAAERATIRYRVQNIPDELKRLDRWILFALEPGRAGRSTKVPYIPGTRTKADCSKPATWRSFDVALAAAERSGLYLGFAFTRELGLTFVDLDGVLGAGGAIKQYAQLIVDTLDSYSEVSLNNGVHVFARGLPPDNFTTEGIQGKVEVYPQTGGRFCLITGDTRPSLGSLDGLIEDREIELATLFPPRPIVAAASPRASQNGTHAELTQDEVDAIVAALRRSWTLGQKHDMGLAIGGILAKNGVPETQALSIVERLSADDERPYDREKAVRDSYKRAGGGLDIRGYQALREMIPGEALSIVDGILDRVWKANQTKIVRLKGKSSQEEDDDALPTTDDPHLTDLGNAKRLVARHGKDLRFCQAKNSWLIWDGKRWRWDESGEVERRAKETVLSLYMEAALLEKGDRKKLIQHAGRSESATRIRAMMALAQSEADIPVQMDQLDADSLLLNCQNGTVDLRTGVLRNHQRADLITRIIDIEHDELAECPRFSAFLAEVLPDQSIRTWVQQFFGYALAGGTGEQVVPIAHGAGQNGKSTLVDVVEHVLGPYCVRADMESFLVNKQSGGGSSATPDLARLKGARVVLASESAQGRKLNVARIKDLAGGESIVARELYGKPFEFRPQFSIWLSTNDKPDVPGNDFALWRRLRLIPFVVKIPEERRILKYEKVLVAEEGPGILTWMLDGLASWQKAGRLPVVESIQIATEEYRIESDPIGQWLEDRCEVGPQFADSASALYVSFKEWWKENELDGKTISQTTFGRELAKKGFDKEKIPGGLYWRNGLKLRPKEETHQ